MILTLVPSRALGSLMNRPYSRDLQFSDTFVSIWKGLDLMFSNMSVSLSQ